MHLRNLAANWIGHAANMAVMFFLSPFIVNTLGKTEYGVWTLMTLLTGYLGIFDLGVRVSTGRHIALYLGRADHDSVDGTIRTGLGIYSLMGLVILCVAIGLGFAFPSIFPSSPPAYHGVVRILLPLMALNLVLSAYGAVFACVLTAHDRFDLATVLALAVLGLRTAGTVIALKYGYGIVGLAVVLIMGNIAGLAGAWLVARKVYLRLKTWPFMFSGVRVRELYGYGIWAFIGALSSKLVGQTDLVVVGALIGVSAVTPYSVGATLVWYSAFFFSVIGGTLFPAVQRAVGRGDMGEARWLYLRQVRLALVLGLPVLTGFAVFGERFIRLWMLGPKFDEPSVLQASIIMVILAAASMARLPAIGAGGLLDATGHVRFNALVSISSSLFTLGLSIFLVLVLGWGLKGIATGTLVSSVLAGMFLVPWYACGKAGVKWSRFLYEVLGRGVLSAAVIATWYLVIRSLVPCDTWVLFGVQVALALLGYAPFALFVLISAEDRRRIWKAARILPVDAG